MIHTIILILLTATIIGFFILFKYINFLMFHFNNEIDDVKKHFNIHENTDKNTDKNTNKKNDKKIFCPAELNNENNECVFDHHQGKYECKFRKLGLLFDSFPGCCSNSCDILNSKINKNLNKIKTIYSNKKRLDINQDKNNTNTIISDNIKESDEIEGFNGNDNKYWCFKRSGKCIQNTSDPLNIVSMNCGINILNNQPSKIYKTEESCLRGDDICYSKNLNDCLVADNCGWCTGEDGKGVCVPGTPIGPENANYQCVPYYSGKKYNYTYGQENPYIM